MSELAQKVLALADGHIKHAVTRAGSSRLGPVDPKSKDGDNVGILSIYVDEFTTNNVSDTEFLAKLRKIEPWGPVVKMTHEAMVNGPPVGDPVNATFRANNLKSLNQVIEK